MQKINRFIKTAHKQALGIVICSPNERFNALDVYNTLEGLTEVQRTVHLECLDKTATPRHLVDSLCIPYEKTFGNKISI